MARARNIKPGFYKNEDLAECSVWARLIFPGLWMLADREGRLEDRPKRIKGELLPFDSQEVDPLLRELNSRGFIQRYQIDGVSYIQISKFSEHQNPHYSEKPSVIKAPLLPESQQHIDPPISENQLVLKRGGNGLIPDSLIPDSPNPEKKQKPRPAAKAAFELPDWVPKPQWEAWVESRKKKRNAPTDFALRLAVGKLEQLKEAGQSPAQVLAQAAFNGWTDLWPVKQQ